MKDRPQIPSPAISFVGRHNSGKTTLIEKVIAELDQRGLDVGSVKHHTHGNFEIDVPGKDSFRHKQAGASEVVIASPVKIARIRDVSSEIECSEIVDSMPGHDVVIVEGYRQSGLPHVEVMRKDNPRDLDFVQEFKNTVCGGSLGNGEAQVGLGAYTVMNSRRPVAVVSDIEEVIEACEKANIQVFDFDDISSICDFIQRSYVRKTITLVIQAGGESKRMGFPKEELTFEGKHVIEAQIERFEDYVGEVVITSNHPERLDFVNHGSHNIPVRVFKDIPPRQGALTGMHTAFANAESERVCCVACDMFFASENLLMSQVKLMNKHMCDVVIPKNKHGREPFHALYNREACLNAVERALDKGEVKVQAFLDDENLEIYDMSQAEVREAVPRGGCFINVNTPDELARYKN